jgi:hypothetical protein
MVEAPDSLWLSAGRCQATQLQQQSAPMLRLLEAPRCSSAVHCCCCLLDVLLSCCWWGFVPSSASSQVLVLMMSWLEGSGRAYHQVVNMLCTSVVCMHCERRVRSHYPPPARMCMGQLACRFMPVHTGVLRSLHAERVSSTEVLNIRLCFSCCQHRSLCNVAIFLRQIHGSSCWQQIVRCSLPGIAVSLISCQKVKISVFLWVASSPFKL